MPTATPPSLSHAPLPAQGFWQRRIVSPIVALLTYGVTPDRIALTLAVGTACSLFPILGCTTALNLGLGLWLRLNQPILQTLNYLLTPLHLFMVVVYVRAGEAIWRAEPIPFSITELMETFRNQPLSEFVHHFGWAGVHALTAWALSVPLILAVVYFPLRPVLKRFAVRKTPMNPS